MSAGIIVMFDVSNTKSLEKIANWLHIISKYAVEGVEILFLANKVDLTKGKH